MNKHIPIQISIDNTLYNLFRWKFDDDIYWSTYDRIGQDNRDKFWLGFCSHLLRELNE